MTHVSFGEVCYTWAGNSKAWLALHKMIWAILVYRRHGYVSISCLCSVPAWHAAILPGTPVADITGNWICKDCNQSLYKCHLQNKFNLSTGILGMAFLRFFLCSPNCRLLGALLCRFFFAKGDNFQCICWCRSKGPIGGDLGNYKEVLWMYSVWITCAILNTAKRLSFIAEWSSFTGSSSSLSKIPCLVVRICVVTEPIATCPVGPGTNI